MSEIEGTEGAEAEHDSGDDYIEQQRARARRKMVAVALVVLFASGYWLLSVGRKRAAEEDLLRELETQALLGDFVNVSGAARRSRKEVSGRDRASAALLSIAIRSQLARYQLFTADHTDQSDAKRMLDALQEQYPGEPGNALPEALWEALRGSPDKVEGLLVASDAARQAPTWAAVARGNAALRAGDLDGALAAFQGQTSPLAKAWLMSIEWEIGDLAAASSTAADLLAVAPNHLGAKVLSSVVTARQSDPAGSIEALGQLIRTTEGLSPVQAALVEVELSRVMRRAGRAEDGEKVLTHALERDENNATLIRELARVQRFKGYFRAARDRADKAMRNRPADPQLMAELAQAAYFNDMVSLIEDRVKKMPSGAEDSDGARRAGAIVALLKGSGRLAVEGLKATRHLGIPGDSELYLAEAWIQVGDFAQARVEAQTGYKKFAATLGADSREAGMAKMYEGLALALAGEEEAATTLLDATFVGQNITPWSAWLFARANERLKGPDSAKDGYLLTCNNGQDFALSCWDLARIYDLIEMDELQRRTQKESRRKYLRDSPKGWHAARVKAALEG